MSAISSAPLPGAVIASPTRPPLAFASSNAFGIFMAVVAFVVVAGYVFWLTPYQEFIFSDMKNYWTQAMKRLAGNEFDDSQFVAWPPMFHIVLAEIFRILKNIGLENWIRIETPLVLNVLIFSASVYAVHRVAARWFDQAWLVLLVSALYAFGFPALYFNAFLLGENIGGPLLVIAISILLRRNTWTWVVASAVLFGLATIIRPSLGPYGLAFVAFLLARDGLTRRFIAQAAVFTAVFFALVTLASAEVSRISGGRVNALSANGGLDFFIANSDYHRVDLSYDGWHFFVVVPAQSWKPENGVFYTNVPFYKQDYYFSLGWQAVQRNPMRLLYNVGELRNLFFADMLPSRYDAPGFRFWRPVWDWFKFLMFVPLGLFFWARRDVLAGHNGRERHATFVMLSSILGVTFVVSFIFTGEPRYTYTIIFVFYLLFFKLVELVAIDWRKWVRPALIYSVIVAVFATTMAFAIAALRPVYPVTIEGTFAPATTEPVTTKAAEASSSGPFLIGRVRFPFNRKNEALVHEDRPEISTEKAGKVRLRTRMEVLGEAPLQIGFRVYSSWGFQLRVNGQPTVTNEAPDYFHETEGSAVLSPGMYDLELEADYLPRSGGLSSNYFYYDSEDDWRLRRALGVSSDRVRFHLPGSQTP